MKFFLWRSRHLILDSLLRHFPLIHFTQIMTEVMTTVTSFSVICLSMVVIEECVDEKGMNDDKTM